MEEQSKNAQTTKRFQTIKNLNLILKETYSKKMVWKNQDYNVNTNPLVIEAGEVEITSDLSQILYNLLSDYFQENTSVIPPKTWDFLSERQELNTRLYKYLTGDLASEKGVLGWVLETPNETMINTLEEYKLADSRRKYNPEIITLLDQGGYECYNIKYKQAESFIISAKQFALFDSLFDECISRLPDDKKPNFKDDSGNISNKKYNDSKKRLSKAFTSFLRGEENKNYLGWTLRII